MTCLNFLFFTYIVLTLLIVVVAFPDPYFNNLLYFFIWNAKCLSTFWVVAHNMWWNLFLLLFVKRVNIWVVAISWNSSRRRLYFECWICKYECNNLGGSKLFTGQQWPSAAVCCWKESEIWLNFGAQCMKGIDDGKMI